MLQFPERGLDDPAAYRGYQTRLYRDAAGNTVQIYLNARDGRVVNLWADAEDESLGFTARDSRGRAVSLRWNGADAETWHAGRARVLQYGLRADVPAVHVGLFLLGSMRVERDFQYANRQRGPFAGAPFVAPEIDRLLAALARLDSTTRREHLATLGAPDLAALAARAKPAYSVDRSGSRWSASVTQPSLDGRDTLRLEIAVDARSVAASLAGDSVVLRARSAGRGVPFTVRMTTTGRALTPLAREEIFTHDFLRFLSRARAVAGAGSPRARWLERQVRGVELLASREKLMAGLPNYATYFGRDMLVSALMMRPIWRGEMSEFAIAGVLRKLGPAGDVSHEEALGGQAVREAAAEYANAVDAALALRRAGRGAAADSVLARARAVIADMRRTRENYHMIDDEFQLPVLAARWLADPGVPAARKRAFLLDTTDYGETRLARLARELALVARMTAAYAERPDATNLVSFPARDSAHWQSASWRDSGAGYAGGRFAMDVNAIWAPSALDAIATIMRALREAGLSPNSLAVVLPELRAGTPLGQYVRDPEALQRAVDTWWGAWRHFLVRLSPAEVRTRVTARLATFNAAERAYWQRALDTGLARSDSVEFLALALDGTGRPIAVANTDPATGLFLGHDRRIAPRDSAAAGRVLRDVRLFVRDYPVGLFVPRVGPLVVNDAYATPDLWRAFDQDPYHGPRVVWGREVNLFLLGVSGAIEDAEHDDAEHAERAKNAEDTEDAGHAGGAGRVGPAYARELRAALRRVLGAVESAGFRSELWTFELRDGRPEPARYGTGSDVQLWSTTDLAVQYALNKLGVITR